MATYTKTNETELALEEQPIYGSSRLGVYRPTAETGIMRGARTYEATNHLGNVLATYTDRIIVNDDFEYSVDVSTVSDYYPFGMPMQGRSFNSSEYRFGFQNQESENEIWGEGNASFFKYRISDNRLGRFFAVDPLAAKYPHNSTYAFSENSTIAFVELEGLEKVVKKWVMGYEWAISTVTWESLYPGEEHGPQGTGTLNKIYKKDKNGELVFQYESYSRSWSDVGNSVPVQATKAIVKSTVESEALAYGFEGLFKVSKFTAGAVANTILFIFSPYEAQAPGVQNYELTFSKYNVIGGSFKNKENADRYAEENKGTVMAPTDDGFYRVSLMETYSEEEATAKQTELDDAGSNSWILKTEETYNTDNNTTDE